MTTEDEGDNSATTSQNSEIESESMLTDSGKVFFVLLILPKNFDLLVGGRLN